MHRPWSSSYKYAFANHGSRLKTDFLSWFSKSVERTDVFASEQFLRRISKFGSITNTRLFYPSDKKRTKQNTEDMREKRLDLDVFLGLN